MLFFTYTISQIQEDYKLTAYKISLFAQYLHDFFCASFFQIYLFL